MSPELLKYVDMKDRIVVGEGKKRCWKVHVICPDCGEGRYVFSYTLKRPTFSGRCQLCRCRFMGKGNVGRKREGEKNGNWKGGRSIGTNNYIIRLLQPDHPFFCMTDARKTIREHRLVMAEHLGRPLLLTELVHHVDGNPSNNHVNNLVLMTRANHIRFERLLKYGKVNREDAIDYGFVHR